MHVVLTRPQADTAPLQARAEAMGWQVLNAPLLDIAFLPIDHGVIMKARAVIATSRNALRALYASLPVLPASMTQKRLYTVGPATTAIARSMGFHDIVEGSGNAESLAQKIIATAENDPRNASFLHLAGDQLAFDIAEHLSRHGHPTTRHTAYRSVAAKTLPPEVCAALQQNELDAVVLMSPRTAKTWAELASHKVPLARLSDLTYICLSQNVANSLPEPLSKTAKIAKRPTHEEIIALLYRLADEIKTR